MKKALLLLLAFGIGNANAAITTYTDRTAFETAAGGVTTEDFESYTTDTPFHTTAVDTGAFTISMSGSPNTNYNFIDIAPPNTSETDVNGTNNMRVFTNTPGINLTFTFDTAITHFGADFRSINDTIKRTQIVVGNDIITLPIAGATGEFSFFGFSSDVAFTSITFEGIANDVYGIDNVSFAAVPEPSTWALMGLGLLGLIAMRRKAA